MGFSRREYWSGLHFPSPGDLPDTGIEPRSPALQADTLPSEPPGKPDLSKERKIESVSDGRVPFFATPWTVARQAPLSMRILQARILEWVAMPSSRGSSQSRDQTQVSLIAGRFFTV